LLGFVPHLVNLHPEAQERVDNFIFATYIIGSRIQHCVGAINFTNSVLTTTEDRVKIVHGIPDSISTDAAPAAFTRTEDGDNNTVLYDADCTILSKCQLVRPEIGKAFLFTPRRERKRGVAGFCYLQGGLAPGHWNETINSYFDQVAPFSPLIGVVQNVLNTRAFALPGGGDHKTALSTWTGTHFSIRRK
jgi:hypothetical protein